MKWCFWENNLRTIDECESNIEFNYFREFFKLRCSLSFSFSLCIRKLYPINPTYITIRSIVQNLLFFFNFPRYIRDLRLNTNLVVLKTFSKYIQNIFLKYLSMILNLKVSLNICKTLKSSGTLMNPFSIDFYMSQETHYRDYVDQTNVARSGLIWSLIYP